MKNSEGALILATILILFVFSVSLLWYLGKIQNSEMVLAGKEIEKWRSLFSIQLYMRVNEIFAEEPLPEEPVELTINDHTIRVGSDGVILRKGE
jgi:hypothetical protein